MMDITDPPAEFDRPDDGLRVVSFGPPPDYSSGEIGTAKFLVDRTEPRFPSIHTYWRPTADDLDQLAAGAVVQFTMVAHTPPPVSAAVYLPVPQPPPDDGTTCGACGHRTYEHGPSGCAADDEAAMGGCWCGTDGDPDLPVLHGDCPTCDGDTDDPGGGPCSVCVDELDDEERIHG